MVASTTSKRNIYTMIDAFTIGVIGAIFGVLFVAWWPVYEAVKGVGGVLASRLLTYGLWFMPAPLAASLIRKPGSAFLGEFVPALLEAIFPTAGGLTSVYYGVVQGALSEIVYAVVRYRRFGVLEAALAGALPGIGAVILDYYLFQDVYPIDYMLLLVLSAMVSGAIYGIVAYIVASRVKS